MPILRGISQKEYRSAVGVSASDLKNLKRSPAYAAYGLKKSSKSMDFGTMVHAYVLEPTTFYDLYAKEPMPPEDFAGKVWRLTKAYKEAKSEIEESGKSMIKGSDIESLELIYSHLEATGIKDIMHLEDESSSEVSVFYEGEESLGYLPRKIRPDKYLPENRTIIDLKTSQDHRPSAFARQCYNFSYHMSAAYYIDTCALVDVEISNYVFVVVNSTHPHEVACYTLDRDSVEQGRREYITLLNRYASYKKEGNWPVTDFADKILEIRIPDYGFSLIEEEA